MSYLYPLDITEREDTEMKYNPSKEELEDIFQTNRYQLIQHLETGWLLPQLRSKGLMDRYDEEGISSPHTHPTSQQKAG